MTIRVEETIESRSAVAAYEPNSRHLELEFVCWDDERPEVDVSPDDVRVEVLDVVSNAPYGLVIYGLNFQSINLKSVTKSIYMATASYGVFEPPKVNAPRFGLSTAGGTEKITHSLKTIDAYPADGYEADKDDYQQAILPTKNGIQGTNRIIPQLTLRVTYYFDPDDWNATLWFLIEELSATWNLFDWHGWPAKTLLFEHAECAEYQLGAGELVPVTFHFKVRRPETVDKGSGITFDKDGWDFVWDDTLQVIKNDEYTGTPRKGSSIRATFREQLYQGSDFELFGMGF